MWCDTINLYNPDSILIDNSDSNEKEELDPSSEKYN